MPVSDKLISTPQKKLLAFDGGGIRGFVSLEILAKMESMLRETKANRNPDFRLSDYFDYIAGTSTGAIIAACLSIGMSVSELTHFYLTAGPDMFSRAGYLRRFRHKYDDEKLASMLKEIVGAETKLGSDKVRTLLMMVMRNATTDSPWPICNNPRAKFNDRSLSECNLELPLWQLIRASTAAPTYFPPEVVRVGGHDFLFVDGGVTTYNNPSFQVFLMATTEPYRLQWPTGVDKMLLVSVGTGLCPDANANLQPEEMNLIYNAGRIPSALMLASVNEQDILCRTFGDCKVGPPIDLELGDLIGKKGPVDSKLFTYVRLNTELSEKGFEELGIVGIRPKDVHSLDMLTHVEELRQIGRAVAAKHLPANCFDQF
jgi:uncharacterized protein